MDFLSWQIVKRQLFGAVLLGFLPTFFIWDMASTESFFSKIECFRALGEYVAYLFLFFILFLVINVFFNNNNKNKILNLRIFKLISSSLTGVYRSVSGITVALIILMFATLDDRSLAFEADNVKVTLFVFSAAVVFYIGAMMFDYISSHVVSMIEDQ